MRPPLTTGRKWGFRLGALSLPLLLLGLMEVGLRLGGYGYDPAFFKTERDGTGRVSLINNDEFTFRFFPPELSRCPAAFKLDAVKPADTQRVFVFGESAAMGDPQPSVGPARVLEALLREKFPGQRFEVINLGITAINSHVILPIAREVAARGQGDIWLLYIGNNEMVGPFGAATVFGNRAAPLTAVRLNLAVQRTRVGQLVVSLLRQIGGNPRTTAWGGMKMFLENQVPPHDGRRETIYTNFDRNLRDIVEVGLSSGAKIVLSTMSVNLRDCPPFGSLLGSELTAAERSQFEAAFTNGITLQNSSQPAAAIPLFAQAAQIDPDFAELQFRWAQCLQGETNRLAAHQHFQQACDVDTLPFRADARINQAIRSLAHHRAGEQLEFCDAEAALAAAAPDGIAGEESFLEHVHFNFDGNYRLGKVWAEHVARMLPEVVQRKAKAGWASQDFCERAIGLSEWNRMTVLSSVRARMQQPPLADQFTNPRRARALQLQFGKIAERARHSNAVALARTEFEGAIARTPNDTSLRENFGTFLKATGDKPAALAQYLKMTELLPHDFSGQLQAGRLLGELGRLAEAEAQLRRAAAQRPFLPDAWFELGVVQAAATNYAAALKSFDRVAKLQPSDVACRTYRARMLTKLDRRAEAIQEYRALIQSSPDRWEPHLELAELLTSDQSAEAIPEYLAAVRLNPSHPALRVKLGMMLARQNRLDEAIQQFQTALDLDPTNMMAGEYLRAVTARRNQPQP